MGSFGISEGNIIGGKHTHTHTHNTRQTATVEKRTFPQKVLIQQPNTQPGLLTEQRIEPIPKESQLAVYQPLRTWRQRQACDSQNRNARSCSSLSPRDGIFHRTVSRLPVANHVFLRSSVATGLEKVSFHSNLKKRQCQIMSKLLHNCTHLTC